MRTRTREADENTVDGSRATGEEERADHGFCRIPHSRGSGRAVNGLRAEPTRGAVSECVRVLQYALTYLEGWTPPEADVAVSAADDAD